MEKHHIVDGSGCAHSALEVIDQPLTLLMVAVAQYELSVRFRLGTSSLI